MPITPWVPAVRTIKDGEDVSQLTVNKPLNQLIQREQHLYEKFEELLGKSVLVAYDQSIHPNELLGLTPMTSGHLNIVYYKSDAAGTGLCRAKTGFSSANNKSMYTPDKSNYTFGILRNINPNGTANCYIEGLCELSVDIDDVDRGLIEVERNSAGQLINLETFEVGPYYLSRKFPGKITKSPAGVPTYVGYAISKRKFLLHPSVDEFSQFFINYRYNLLDRPAATPILVGNTWSIPGGATMRNRLGWVPASLLAGIYDVPVGAKFYYNIPANFSQETGILTSDEIVEAQELKSLLPPVPANFIELTVNGVIQRLRDEYAPDGIYKINDYGIWWFEDTHGLQPWADDLLLYSVPWDPDDWTAFKGGSALRPRFFVSFSKFNPALRTQLVSSLQPFSQPGVEDSSAFIQFYLKENPNQLSPTGDLLAKVTPQFIDRGASRTFSTPSSLTTTYSSGGAVADLSYDSVQGKFLKSITPVVSGLVGVGGISVDELNPGTGDGKYSVSYLASGMYGQIDSVEPINSRLEFRGVHSYIKLPYYNPVTVPYGLIGKIVLPKKVLNSAKLCLILQVFGTTGYASTATDRTITFSFEYAVSTAQNGGAPASVKALNQFVTPLAQAVIRNTVDLTPTGDNYQPYSVFNLEDVLTIPATNIGEDSVVNFKMLRNYSITSGNYTGDIGILSMYWGIKT
jgi:hypothetical protein